MTSSIVESVQTAIGKRMAVWSLGDRSVVATPWTLQDDTPVTLYVEQVGADLFNVTDAGLAASALADEGVDLSRRVPSESFDLIRQNLRLAPGLGPQTSAWDIVVSTTADEIGEAVIEVGEAVIRAEGLKALGRRRSPQTFGDRVVRAASEVGLRVEPRALIPLRHLGAKRRVAYRLSSQRSDAFVQTITRASSAAGYDHAKALFSDSSVDEQRRVTALERSVVLDPWQLEGLSEVSHVVKEPDLERFLQGI